MQVQKYVCILLKRMVHEAVVVVVFFQTSKYLTAMYTKFRWNAMFVRMKIYLYVCLCICSTSQSVLFARYPYSWTFINPNGPSSNICAPHWSISHWHVWWRLVSSLNLYTSSNVRRFECKCGWREQENIELPIFRHLPYMRVHTYKWLYIL